MIYIKLLIISVLVIVFYIHNVYCVNKKKQIRSLNTLQTWDKPTYKQCQIIPTKRKRMKMAEPSLPQHPKVQNKQCRKIPTRKYKKG
jgi:predicted nucleic acid-binding protein